MVDNNSTSPTSLNDFAEGMMADGEDGKERLEKAAQGFQAEMEAGAEEIRTLVAAQPPTTLLGYLWSQYFMGALDHQKKAGDESGPSKDLIKRFQFVFEYVHAVWSSHKGTFAEGALDEAKAKKLLETCDKLSDTAMFYAMASSQLGKFVEFGDATPDVEFQAKSAWILIRGHRYQVLEREFFEFSLMPHEEELKAAYGVGAVEIAAGIQAITDSIRVGYSDAMTKLFARFKESQAKITEEGLSLAEAVEKIKAADKSFETDVGGALKALFSGGICNLSENTKLPEKLLQDLAYQPGSEESFFADGPFKGTPLRTLPARVRPLVKLADGYYATDGQFVRDSSYRAIQRGLIARRPDYREGWNRNQKAMAETAFSKILTGQLKGARIYKEVFFKDPMTGEWVETDLVGIIDDILFVVEAKAGVMAMQSPAMNFESHIRTIRELVLKAYRQCSRFLTYLAGGAEMPIYELRDGAYEEVAKINLEKFRRVFPIGLTVEAFTPFSAMCKEIPEVVPILGKHPFMSLSVDDLFVLRRFLPSAGELFHYLEVRQAVAGIPQATIFDELDHLGAYIVRNRFDVDIRKQLEEADRVAWDSFCDRVDRHFEQEEWEKTAVPCQVYPERVNALLGLLDRDRPKGWLRIDAEIRNFDESGRKLVGSMLDETATSLDQFPIRRMVFGNDNPVQICLTTQIGLPAETEKRRHGEIACLAAQKPRIIVLRVQCDTGGTFLVTSCSEIAAPSILRNDYAALKAEADLQIGRNKAKKRR